MLKMNHTMRINHQRDECGIREIDYISMHGIIKERRVLCSLVKEREEEDEERWQLIVDLGWVSEKL